jgi:hypothetical protein
MADASAPTASRVRPLNSLNCDPTDEHLSLRRNECRDLFAVRQRWWLQLNRRGGKHHAVRQRRENIAAFMRGMNIWHAQRRSSSNWHRAALIGRVADSPMRSMWESAVADVLDPQRIVFSDRGFLASDGDDQTHGPVISQLSCRMTAVVPADRRSVWHRAAHAPVHRLGTSSVKAFERRLEQARMERQGR